MREKLLAEKTAILTSATLKLGGDFSVGGRLGGAGPRPPRVRPGRASTSARPFDYATQAILYVAKHLPPPGP